MNQQFCFRVSVETNDQTGDVMAVYFQIRKGRSAEVKEFARGKAFADYDRRGQLLGIEMLAPCSVKVLDKIASDEPAKKFVRRAAPSSMLVKS